MIIKFSLVFSKAMPACYCSSHCNSSGKTNLSCMYIVNAQNNCFKYKSTWRVNHKVKCYIYTSFFTLDFYYYGFNIDLNTVMDNPETQVSNIYLVL